MEIETFILMGEPWTPAGAEWQLNVMKDFAVAREGTVIDARIEPTDGGYSAFLIFECLRGSKLWWYDYYSGREDEIRRVHGSPPRDWVPLSSGV